MSNLAKTRWCSWTRHLL